jgi:chaperone modulatory protein CbpM
MTTFEEVLRVYRLQQVELQAWVEQRWVRPRPTPQGLVFDEADEARIALINELRRDFLCNDDTLDVVLSLLDQLYAARRVLKEVDHALAALPLALREEVRAKLKATARG